MEHELTAEQEAVLLHDNILKPGTSAGSRRVSQGLLSPPDTASVRSVSSLSSGSSECSQPAPPIPTPSAADAFVEVPIKLQSIEGIRFAGFNEDTALAILQSWTNRPDPSRSPDDLLEYILGHLSQQYSPGFTDLGLDARQTMEILGVDSEVISAILDPRYECVYETETLDYWIEDTVSIRYWTLQDLLARLKVCGEQAVERQSKRMEESADHSVRTSQQWSGGLSAGRLDLGGKKDYLHGCPASIDGAPQLPDHTTLYKGKASQGLLRPVEGPLIRSNGETDFGPLRTMAGGDFNGTNLALYWSDSKACAEIYRQYAAQRCPHSETWVLEIQVPNSFLNGLNTQTINFSHAWKEYVWLCRYKKPQTLVPIKFNNLTREADLIKGNILFHLSTFLNTIDYDSVRTRITEQDVMSIQGVRCTQWAFMKEEAIDGLAAIVQGKIRVDRHQPLSLPS